MTAKKEPKKPVDHGHCQECGEPATDKDGFCDSHRSG